MNGKNAKPKDFKTILQERKTFIDRREDLELRTETNKVWINTGANNYIDISEAKITDVIKMIDFCFERVYKLIDNAYLSRYYSKLVLEIKKKSFEFDWLTKNEDNQVNKWPGYAKHRENVFRTINKFEASYDASELRQIQKEWKRLSKTPSGNFHHLDWSISNNRKQLAEWLNSNEDYDLRYILEEIDYSECFEYEDFKIHSRKE